MGLRSRLLVAVMISVMLLELFGCAGKSPETVTSIETMTLIRRGMRGGTVLEFVLDGDHTELRCYREVISAGGTTLVPEASVVVEEQVMAELMNRCGILRWDGFHGKHPRRVLDGIVFTFTASVNGGQTVRADGSANFPGGYREFVQALDGMLAASENEKITEQEK